MKNPCFIAVSLFLSAVAVAQTPPGGPQGPGGPPGGKMDPARFAEVKQTVLQRQQARIDLLQQGLSCIQQAQDQAALRLCVQKERAAMQKERGKMGGPQGGPPRAP